VKGLLECTHTVNTMKMRWKTINRPITSIADSQLSVELLEESGNTTIRSTINSTDRQLIAKSDKTSVECRYSTDEWDADARAVAGSTAGSSATYLIKVGLTDSAYMQSVQKLMQIHISTIAAKEWMYATQQHTTADSLLRAIVRINCSNTHIYTLKLHGNWNYK